MQGKETMKGNKDMDGPGSNDGHIADDPPLSSAWERLILISEILKTWEL